MVISAGRGFLTDGTVGTAATALRTNARMYGITPRAAAAWEAIFAWLETSTGIPLTPIDHPPPTPLAELWSQPRLGCVVMCGWPFIKAVPRPQVVATPVPAPTRYRGQARYWSDLVVRADSAFETIADTFGGTLGWTVEDSHSGFNMLRHHLMGLSRTRSLPLYRRSVGGLINPLGALTAVAEGRVDIAPVDSFCHDILKAEDHAATRATRTIATTAPSPMPVLIASPDVPENDVQMLSRALRSAHLDPQLTRHLADALVQRFETPNIMAFQYCNQIERISQQAGYTLPEWSGIN